MSKIVTVFGSSRPQRGESEYLLAEKLGRALGEAGYTLCNGGYGGIMEASASGARQVGGHTIGITCSAFGGGQPNRWTVETVQQPTLIERMMALITRADGYVILKGGTGTLLELAAVWELMNKGLLTERPVILLGDFWSGVIATLKEELAWEGREDCTRYIRSANSVEECIWTLDEKLGGSNGQKDQRPPRTDR